MPRFFCRTIALFLAATVIFSDQTVVFGFMPLNKTGTSVPAKSLMFNEQALSSPTLNALQSIIQVFTVGHHRLTTSGLLRAEHLNDGIGVRPTFWSRKVAPYLEALIIPFFKTPESFVAAHASPYSLKQILSAPAEQQPEMILINLEARRLRHKTAAVIWERLSSSWARLGLGFRAIGSHSSHNNNPATAWAPLALGPKDLFFEQLAAKLRGNDAEGSQIVMALMQAFKNMKADELDAFNIFVPALRVIALDSSARSSPLARQFLVRMSMAKDSPALTAIVDPIIRNELLPALLHDLNDPRIYGVEGDLWNLANSGYEQVLAGVAQALNGDPKQRVRALKFIGGFILQETPSAALSTLFDTTRASGPVLHQAESILAEHREMLEAECKQGDLDISMFMNRLAARGNITALDILVGVANDVPNHFTYYSDTALQDLVNIAGSTFNEAAAELARERLQRIRPSKSGDGRVDDRVMRITIETANKNSYSAVKTLGYFVQQGDNRALEPLVNIAQRVGENSPGSGALWALIGIVKDGKSPLTGDVVKALRERILPTLAAQEKLSSIYYFNALNTLLTLPALTGSHDLILKAIAKTLGDNANQVSHEQNLKNLNGIVRDAQSSKSPAKFLWLLDEFSKVLPSAEDQWKKRRVEFSNAHDGNSLLQQISMDTTLSPEIRLYAWALNPTASANDEITSVAFELLKKSENITTQEIIIDGRVKFNEVAKVYYAAVWLVYERGLTESGRPLAQREFRELMNEIMTETMLVESMAGVANAAFRIGRIETLIYAQTGDQFAGVLSHELGHRLHFMIDRPRTAKYSWEPSQFKPLTELIAVLGNYSFFEWMGWSEKIASTQRQDHARYVKQFHYDAAAVGSAEEEHQASVAAIQAIQEHFANPLKRRAVDIGYVGLFIHSLNYLAEHRSEMAPGKDFEEVHRVLSEFVLGDEHIDRFKPIRIRRNRFGWGGTSRWEFALSARFHSLTNLLPQPVHSHHHNTSQVSTAA